MAEFSHFRSSVARKVDEKIPGSGIGPGDRSNSEAGKYCAYNQTRQRFLCANVEAADVSTTRLDARLPGITPSSGAGLWIVPIQIISPTSVRVPLDLIYLDRNSVVLDAVESFPLAQATASIGAATSILALPSQTIASTGTQPGDRLILCAPEEMKLRLQQIGRPDTFRTEPVFKSKRRFGERPATPKSGRESNPLCGSVESKGSQRYRTGRDCSSRFRPDRPGSTRNHSTRNRSARDRSDHIRADSSRARRRTPPAGSGAGPSLESRTDQELVEALDLGRTFRPSQGAAHRAAVARCLFLHRWTSRTA